MSLSEQLLRLGSDLSSLIIYFIHRFQHFCKRTQEFLSFAKFCNYKFFHLHKIYQIWSIVYLRCLFLILKKEKKKTFRCIRGWGLTNTFSSFCWQFPNIWFIFPIGPHGIYFVQFRIKTHFYAKKKIVN